MHKTFEYYLAEDIELQVEVWYSDDDGEKVVDEIVVSQVQGCDIFTELDDLYERDFGKLTFTSVADKIKAKAERYWEL